MVRFGRILFAGMWLTVLGLAVTAQVVMAARYGREMAIIHQLGGVLWEYQSDKDDTIFVVRHPDGYFGLISIISSELATFMLWFAGVGLALGALVQRFEKTGVAGCAILSGFLVVFGIIVAGALAGGPPWPVSPYETLFDPADRQASAYGDAVGLCGLSGGQIVFQPGSRSADWWDVDVLSDGKMFMLNSFHNPAPAQALLVELAAAQHRAGCS